MNKDGIKKLRRSSGTDDVQEEETKLEADIVDSLDEIMDIITAVIGFGKFRTTRNGLQRRLMQSSAHQNTGHPYMFMNDFLTK